MRTWPGRTTATAAGATAAATPRAPRMQPDHLECVDCGAGPLTLVRPAGADQGEDDQRIAHVAEQIIAAYPEGIDFDAHAAAAELVRRFGFTDLETDLHALPGGQATYWSTIARHDNLLH